MGCRNSTNDVHCSNWAITTSLEKQALTKKKGKEMKEPKKERDRGGKGELTLTAFHIAVSIGKNSIQLAFQWQFTDCK